MDTLLKKRFKKLFDNLCCSLCKNNFDENSITILQKEKGLAVINLCCKHCGKDFGTAFVGTKPNLKEAIPLEIQEGAEPINYDDVIDAHRFIKDINKHWMNNFQKLKDCTTPDKF